MTSKHLKSDKQWHRGTSVILGVEIAVCGVVFLMVSSTQANGPAGGGIPQSAPQPSSLPFSLTTDDVSKQSAQLAKSWFDAVDPPPRSTEPYGPEPSPPPSPATSTPPEPQSAPPSSTRSRAAAREPVSRSDSNFIIPIRYDYISRRLIYGVHTGIDFVTDSGTPVYAASSGTVIDADGRGWNSGWGKTVVIDHGSGVTTRYAHLQQIEVEVGQTIPQGELLGHSGSTGRSTGPHLHFEARRNGRPFDPFI